MRIYGDSVVSSDLSGEGVNFILGRFLNYYNCLIKHSYHKPKHCGCFATKVSDSNTELSFSSNISAYASMKKTKHFVYVFQNIMHLKQFQMLSHLLFYLIKTLKGLKK